MEQAPIQEPEKSGKGTLIAVAVVVLIVLGGGIYWFTGLPSVTDVATPEVSPAMDEGPAAAEPAVDSSDDTSPAITDDTLPVTEVPGTTPPDGPAPVKHGQAEPLSYSLEGVDATVAKTIAPFDFTAAQLQALADECGTQYEAGYFDTLISEFSGATKTVYTFTSTDTSQVSTSFVVTLLPNKPNYAALDEFKKDFHVCSAGGDAYPTLMSSNWLLFENACGSGADDAASGCDALQKAIEPTLKLN